MGGVTAQNLAAAGHDLSLWGLFLQADWVVKAVMIGLLFASVWVWAIVFEKITSLRRLNREADAFTARRASARRTPWPPSSARGCGSGSAPPISV